MKTEAYSLLKNMENSWWYRGRRLVVQRILTHFSKQNQTILDIGAGYGGMFSMLKNFGEVSALEPYPEAAEQCQKRGYAKVYSSLEEISQNKELFSLIGAFDVVEHIEDDQTFIKSLHSRLQADGALVITVPAFPLLWNQHDIDHHHYRRYTKKTLVTLLENNGFMVNYVSYWNVWLFLPALLLRSLGKTGGSTLESTGWLGKVLYAVIQGEAKAMPFVSYPFGVSLVVYTQPVKKSS